MARAYSERPITNGAVDGGAEAGTNWAGNLRYHATRVYQPTTVAEAQELVARSRRLRPLGTRHCFNRIADSEAAQVSVRALDALIEIDKEAMTATVGGGASYGQICRPLDEQGYALRNLASLPHISVVGAVATATHGSGADNPNMAMAVSAVEFIDARGDLVTLSRAAHGDVFGGVPVHLGGLGLITKVTLDLVPTYAVRQHVYLGLPQAVLRDHFEAIMGSAYSVSLFTDYRGGTVKQVWCKQQAERSARTPEPDFFGARPAEREMHPLDTDPAACTDQQGAPGPWYDRLPHFRLGFTPSGGEEIQSEYFVPREHSVDAYEALAALAEVFASYLYVSEVRLVDADDLWMSTAYRQPKTAFHFTWRRDTEGVRRVLPLIEEALQPFDPVPHWGKVFAMAPETLRSKYDRLGDFKDLLATYDPDGKFRNAYLRYYLYGADALTPADMW